MIGTRLGPYEITAKLGEGGMGVVYRAKDFHLGRDVALKVLPEGFTQDPERLARFEREAQLLAQLNHPNIAQIYGLEKSGETRALVLELVDGPTLAERLESGALPFNESLSISVQIALALEEAHEKGIVHRDLKPQNVKASIEGKVKVLDFGLAKAMDPASAASGGTSASQLAQSPTLTMGATQMGVILGTASYMSPEQAKGMAVDKRADIWAFGVVLFEMLTGRSLFAGDSVPDTLARVLQREIDFTLLPDSVPPAMRRLLRRCLERSSKNRLHDIADARLVLDELISGKLDDDGSSVSAAAAAPALEPLWRRGLPWAVAVAGIGWGIWATLGAAAGERRPAAVPVAFTVPARSADGQAGRLHSVVVSRDGRRLAILDGSAPALLVRELGSFETRSVPGTAGATNPFFSPDGDWLGFNVDGALRKVALAGGDPVKLCDTPTNAPGATWGPDAAIYFTPTWTSGLWRVSDQGGKPEQLTAPDPGKSESGHYWPSFLPDGRAALFTIFGAAGIRDSKVAILDLESRQIEVLASGAGAQYVASGHLVLFRHGVWLALPFDPKARRIMGPESRILPELRPLDPVGDSQRDLAIADNGLLAYIAADSPPSASFTRFAWIDRAGHVEPSSFAGRHYSWQGIALAPDERRVAVAIASDGEIQVWLYDFERGTKEQLTRDGQNFNPAWHPDGTRLAVASLLRGSFDLRLVRADGGAPPVALLASERDEQELSWSADGRQSVYTIFSPDTGKDIWTLAEGAAARARAVVASPFDDDNPQLAPDGRWLSYASQGKLYVMGFPDGGERIQVSAGSSFATWSRTTPELFYLEGGKLVALRYEISGGRFRPLDARPLFELPPLPGQDGFAVARDAQRFLFLIPEPGKSVEPELRVLTDGFAALGGAAVATADAAKP